MSQEELRARLSDAISGERRHWHKVEVAPDDIAAILALAAPSTEPALDWTVVHRALSDTGGCDHSDWRSEFRCKAVLARLAESQP